MSQNKSLPSVFNNKLFTGLTESQINLKVTPKDFVEYKEGDIIFMSGEKSEYLFLVVEGEVKIKLPGAKRLPQIDQKGKNEFFGAKELIDKTDRKSSAVANKDSILFPITNEKLIELASKNRKLKINLYKYSKMETPEDLKDEDKPKEMAEKIYASEIDNEFKNEAEHLEISDNLNSAETIENIDGKAEAENKFLNEQNNIEDNSFRNFNEELNDPDKTYSDEGLNNFELENNEQPKSELINKDEECENRFYNKYYGKFTEALGNENIDNKKLSEILQALQRINSKHNPDDVIFSIAESAKILTDADECLLFIVKRDAYEIETKYKTDTENKEAKFKINENLAGAAAENYQIINIKNAKEDKRYSHEKDNLTNIEVSSILYFPITSEEGKIIAIIQLLSSEFNKFSEAEENLLSIISIHAAQAIQNAIAFESTLYEDRKATLSKVVAFLSNDIHQPIQNINEYIEKVDENGKVNKLRPLFELLKEQTASINNFSEALIHYSSDKFQMKEYQLQFSGVINKILENIAEYAASRTSNLYKKINADAMVNINPNAFYQAVYQIIKNACDSMREGGNIFVTINKDDDGNLITEISDQGLGVPESIKQEIFDPFMTQGKENGVGLGLAVAKKIIEQHRGSITVESDLGEGSKFKIYLPIADAIE